MRLREWDDMGVTELRLHVGKDSDKRYVCFESVDGEIQSRSEGASLCLCGSR